MQEQPSRRRRPWWMHALLSPWYLIKALWGIGELAESIYFLIVVLAVLVLIAFVSFTFIRDLIF